MKATLKSHACAACHIHPVRLSAPVLEVASTVDVSVSCRVAHQSHCSFCASSVALLVLRLHREPIHPLPQGFLRRSRLYVSYPHPPATHSPALRKV
eukprot:scaffold434_cov186-Pinguiococcus_pyrenoidosus.AAC.149